MASETDIEHDAEAGGAMIEFIVLGTLLLLPTIYFLMAVFSLQSGAMAAAAASQQAVQVIESTENRQQSLGLVHSAAAFAVQDYGISADQVNASAACLDEACDKIRVSVTVSVKMPLLPWSPPGGIAEMTSNSMWWGGKYR